MHFSSLIAAFMLPLAVLGTPIARAGIDDINHAIGLFRGGVDNTLTYLDNVHNTASSIVIPQVAPLVNQVEIARKLVGDGRTSIDAGFSQEGAIHTPDVKYVEAYSSLLARVLTTVFVLLANARV